MKTEPANDRVSNRHYDLTGHEMPRIGKHWFISRLSQYENLSGGPGWKSILFLFGLHYLRHLFGPKLSVLEKVAGKYLNH